MTINNIKTEIETIQSDLRSLNATMGGCIAKRDRLASLRWRMEEEMQAARRRETGRILCDDDFDTIHEYVYSI